MKKICGIVSIIAAGILITGCDETNNKTTNNVPAQITLTEKEKQKDKDEVARILVYKALLEEVKKAEFTPEELENIQIAQNQIKINYFIERDVNKFMVFSDDMMQAIQRINKEKYPNAQFEYSIDKTPEEDLYLGSCCEHNIISASTFSWLQAWTGRNENKIVIAPKVWFEFMNSHLNTDDIVPERWLKM